MDVVGNRRVAASKQDRNCDSLAGLRLKTGRAPRAGVLWGLLGAALALAMLAPAAGAQQQVAYSIAPAPAWVEAVALPPLRSQAQPKGGVHLRLLDMQLSALPGAAASYRHSAVMVHNAQALGTLGQLQFEFIPEHQRLTIHAVTIERDGRRIDKLRGARIDLLRREARLEWQIYDGTYTAVVLVEDLRVGDTLEFAYTVEGTNPMLGADRAGGVPLGVEWPVDLLHVRALAPAARPFRFLVLNSNATPQVESTGEVQTLRLQLRDVPAVSVDPQTVRGRNLYPMLLVSQYDSWKQVAEWADRLYRVPDELSADLQNRISRWRAESGSLQEAIERALDFVQKDVRYVGVEIGQASHLPAHPDRVFAQRYGDCKDKSVLLAAVVRALGASAYPALVSTSLSADLSRELPSAGAFDHMLVLVEAEGRTWWLDPTRLHQAGRLDQRFPDGFAWALVTGKGERRLREMVAPADYSYGVVSQHRFVVRDYESPVDLDIEFSLSGSAAEYWRAALARSTDEVAKYVLEATKRFYPGLRAVSPLAVHEEPGGNRITLQQRFQVDRLFERSGDRPQARLVATAMLNGIPGLDDAPRDAPLPLVFPFGIKQTISVALPEDIGLPPIEPLEIENDYARFRLARTYTDKRLVLEYEFATRRESVPPSRVEAYGELLRRMYGALAYRLPIDRAPAADSLGLRLTNRNGIQRDD
jgi:transglutaminase-like putative cysteine protease